MTDAVQTDKPVTDTSRTPTLKLDHVYKHFGGLVAVNDVSLAIYPGEVVALLGDNGAGKSTLIKMVSGVNSFDGGEMYFNGEKVTLHTPAFARQLGIETIYQDLALAENLDVGANVFMGREVVKKRMFGLTICATSPKRFSTGSISISRPYARLSASCPAGSGKLWQFHGLYTGM